MYKNCLTSAFYKWRVLFQEHFELFQELFLCLGTRSIEGVLTACLCADDVPKISSECTVMATVTSWWKRLLNGKFTKTMTATTYEQLVSR